MGSSWEHADIKLPSAEFARFRQAVAEEELAHQNDLYAHSQTFWRGLTAAQRSNRAAYEAAFEAYEREHTIVAPARRYPLLLAETSTSSLPHGLGDFVRARRHACYTGAPARVQKDSVAFPNNRTTVFASEDGSANVTFVKEINTVQWNVPEGEDAVRTARSSRLADVFFRQLRDTRWSRNTGGVIFTGEQYRRDAGDYGGLESLISGGFGPVGAGEAPYLTDDYRMVDGRIVTVEEFPAAIKAARVQAKHARRAAKAKSKTGPSAQRAPDQRIQENRTGIRHPARMGVGADGHREIGPQGRLGAGSGPRSGEWTAKDQSMPEIHLAAVAAHV
jgi:hypothetical protein